MRYYKLKTEIKSASHREFVARKLLELRKELALAIPEKKLDKNMLLATWNIRDFDSNKFGHGPRLAESYFYIAQIISAFDLIAVQEVNKNLRALKKLIYILGPNWDYITTDLTEGKSGNQERMTFIYDKRRVSFKNMAGEIVLPKTTLIRGDVQFARTPFVVSFQSGWAKFDVCTVHIYFGADSGEKLHRRKSEIAGIAKFLKKRADRDRKTLIVLGDFNIVDHEHETMKSLVNNGFKIPDQIQNNPVGTNAAQSKHYDQIAIRSKSSFFELGTQVNSAGAFNYFKHIMSESAFENYKQNATDALVRQMNNRQKDLDKESSKANPNSDKILKLNKAIDKLRATISNENDLKEYYNEKWKTFQISDHLPLWTEIQIDNADAYLENTSS